VFSRFIVGCRVSNSLHADLALDALDMTIWRRQHHDLAALIHHSESEYVGAVAPGLPAPYSNGRARIAVLGCCRAT
jgi:transposase InsO family protein